MDTSGCPCHGGDGVQSGMLNELGVDRNTPECANGLFYSKLNISNHSQMRSDLSSEVDTNRRFLSKKVMEFTGPKCRSYS